MGRFDPYQLADWHRDHGAALVDPNRSVPIGKCRQISSVEATLVHLVYVKDKAMVVYGEEVRLNSIQGCPVELPEEIGQMLGVRRLTGWLFYTDKKKYKKHDLVVSEVSTRNVYFQAKLQAARHRKKSEVVSDFRNALEKTGLTDRIQALSWGLSTLSFQPLESRTNVVSALLIEPKRIEELAITQRTRGAKISYEETMNTTLQGSFKAEVEWSLGICNDIDGCIGLLDVDEEKAHLFQQTENGELFKNYPAGEKGRLPGSGPIYRLMTAIAASLHESVYRAAVMTALAGIDENIYSNDAKDNPRPVMKQVTLMYHRFMYALVERCGFSAPVVRPTEFSGSGKVPSSGPFTTEREELEEMHKKIRPLGPEVFIAGMERRRPEPMPQTKHWLI